jgi:hypothetical protein
MPPKKAKSKKTEKPAPLSVAEPAVGYETTPRKKTLSPLTGADWVHPGRPATDEEMEQLVQEMLSEKGGISTKELRKKALTWRKKK